MLNRIDLIAWPNIKKIIADAADTVACATATAIISAFSANKVRLTDELIDKRIFPFLFVLYLYFVWIVYLVEEHSINNEDVEPPAKKYFFSLIIIIYFLFSFYGNFTICRNIQFYYFSTCQIFLLLEGVAFAFENRKTKEKKNI